MNNNNHNTPIPVGFRFHPTDEELVGYYLHGKVGRAQRDQLIQELDLYKIEPWDLQEKCRLGEDAAENQSDWYFFSHKDKKYPTGQRANRATTAGFWKATGRDKPIHTQRHVIGMRKTLVFYRGRAPHGQKTDWIMHEFRLDEGPGVVPNYESDGWVVCRVFRKTKYFKTKSQDTSCSFEEDQQGVSNHHLLPELISPPAKFLFTDVANGIHSSSLLHQHPNTFTTVNNHTCKQEISVADYSAAIHDHSGIFQSHQSNPGSPMYHHQPQTLEMRLHNNIPSLATCSSSSLRDLRSCVVDHSHEFSAVNPMVHNVDTLDNRDFEDARSSVTQEAAAGPAMQQHEESPYDWMHLEGARVPVGRRRDQTLADVTCHVGRMKRQAIATDLLSTTSNYESNLVQAWNSNV